MGRLFLLLTLAVTCVFASPDRVAGPVDNSRTTLLHGHVLGGSRLADDRGPVAAEMKLSYVSVLLKPDAAVEGFLAELQTPGSARYHKWLTPVEFGARFGASSKDMGAVTAWLRSENLQVENVARGGLWVTFSGTAREVGHALHTNFRHYQWAGKLHYAAAVEPSIPQALSALIAGFRGLDDFGVEPQYRVVPYFNSGANHFLAPDDIATIYNMAGLYGAGFDGTGQKIAVLGQTGIDLTDVRSFRKRFNLPANDPQLMLVGPDPGILSKEVVEANLDLQWTGAVAKNASLFYVFAKNVFTAAQYSVDNNIAPVMSFSYGTCEPEVSGAFRAVAQQANAQGITWMVSSGDSGAATCDVNAPTPQASKGNTVSFPASIPEITAVGGTQFDETGGSYWAALNGPNGGSALSYIPERAWNDSAARNQLSSAGGGASTLFPKPFWQTGPGVPADNSRDVPDVALAASPDHDGYLLINSGNLVAVGGTSASTPVFAGIVSLLNQYLAQKGEMGGLGNINPALYRMAQTAPDAFHDVVNGDIKVPCEQSSPNCVDGLVGYAAGPGYDLATGLGSVDAFRLASDWNQGAVSTLTLTANPNVVTLTGNIQLTAVVKGAVGVVTPTGSVSFFANDLAIGTAALGANGSASVTVPAGSIAAGNGTVSALYSGDGVFLGSGAVVPMTLSFPAGQSAVVASISPNPVRQVGSSWPYTITLADKSGVAATLTEFTVNGVINLANFPDPRIPANGVLTTSLAASGLTVPLTRNFHFAGTDVSGATWTQDLAVPFLGPEGPYLTPTIRLTAAPAAVQQDPQATASCQWQNRIAVTEESGFLVQLTRLIVGGTDLSSQIPQLFGTTRLAPYGKLLATVCQGGVAVPSTKSYQISGVSELGSTVTASANVNFAAAATNPTRFAASLTTSNLAPAIDVRFDNCAASWTAEIVGSKAATSWLTLSQSSGTGCGQILLQESDTGLSRGVYQAIVRIQTSNALPQVAEVPVILVAGGSSGITVGGVANAASFKTTLAPGAIMSVFGTGLASTLQSAPRLPLPLNLAGVSATVNGITAPIYFASPGQLNVQVPYETGAGAAVLGVTYNGQVAAFPFTVAPTAPGIFAAGDGSLVPFNSGSVGQVLLAFITGEGDVTPSIATGATSLSTTALGQLPHARQAISLTVGGMPAALAFAGIPSGLAGATQINFTVPAGLAPGVYPVVVTVGGVDSAPVTLTVK